MPSRPSNVIDSAAARNAVRDLSAEGTPVPCRFFAAAVHQGMIERAVGRALHEADAKARQGDLAGAARICAQAGDLARAAGNPAMHEAASRASFLDQAAESPREMERLRRQCQVDPADTSSRMEWVARLLGDLDDCPARSGNCPRTMRCGARWHAWSKARA